MSSFLRVDPRTGRLGDFDWSSLANTFVAQLPNVLQTTIPFIKPNVPPQVQTVLTQLFPPAPPPPAIQPTVAAPLQSVFGDLFASTPAKIGGLGVLGYVLWRVLGKGGRRR